MNTTNRFSKSLLATSIAIMFALTGATACAQDENTELPTTYTDPVSGEIKDTPKLLSQMSEEERAALNDEEIKFLEDLEVHLKETQPQSPE